MEIQREKTGNIQAVALSPSELHVKEKEDVKEGSNEDAEKGKQK